MSLLLNAEAPNLQLGACTGSPGFADRAGLLSSETCHGADAREGTASRRHFSTGCPRVGFRQHRPRRWRRRRRNPFTHAAGAPPTASAKPPFLSDSATRNKRPRLPQGYWTLAKLTARSTGRKQQLSERGGRGTTRGMKGTAPLVRDVLEEAPLVGGVHGMLALPPYLVGVPQIRDLRRNSFFFFFYPEPNALRRYM